MERKAGRAKLLALIALGGMFPFFTLQQSLLVSAIVFGILNAIIKPILIIFTLPINALTLGLFTVIINAIILELASYWVNGFHLDSFLTAVLSALVISFVSILLSAILGDGD